MSLQIWHRQAYYTSNHPSIINTPLQTIKAPYSSSSVNSSDEMTNPMSYPGEFDEECDNTTYDGELREGEERPHMLHAVCRIRSTCRRPWWERDTIEALGLKVSC